MKKARAKQALRSPIVELRSRSVNVVLCSIGLAATVVALYWGVLGNQFIDFDDPIYVTANDHVKGGLTLKGFGWAFTNLVNYWHPLTWLSHMLDVQIFGLDPAGHHLVSVLWHAANSALILSALWYMTGSLWRSAFVAALFALHPLRVESVAWVSERKDVLSAFFFFATLWAYAWYARRSSAWRRYLLVAVLFSFSLMAKPSSVSLPFLLLLLDKWPLRRTESFGKLLWEKIPLFGMAALVSGITYFAQDREGAMGNIENLSFLDRLANAAVSYSIYIWKIVWPHHLAVIYPYPRELQPLIVLGACTLLFAVTALVLLRRHKLPYLPVAWFWFLGVMIPMIGLVQVGRQPYADRYTYIPSIGIFVGLVWLFADAIENYKWRRQAAIAVALATLPALAFAASSQMPYWHDDLTLFQHAADVTSGSPIALFHVGDDLLQTGRSNEAIPYLSETVQLQPTFLYLAYGTLGRAQAASGQIEPALRSFSEALRIKPDYQEAYYARGITLLNSEDPKAAETDLRQALQLGLSPEHASNAYNALGTILAQRDDIKGAAAQFEQAVAAQPTSVDAQRNLALTLMHQGRTEEAIRYLERAIVATHGDAGLATMLEDFRTSSPIDGKTKP